MKNVFAVILAFLLVGCEPEWERAQYERCYNRNGDGNYNRVTLIFTCWERTEPPSHKRKLYEIRYK